MPNPDASPKADGDAVRVRSDSRHPCPKCGGRSATKVGFNWWGGALGPKLFHVVRCQSCKTQYNGKTGKGLGKVILVYNLVAIVLFGAAAIWWKTTFR